MNLIGKDLSKPWYVSALPVDIYVKDGRMVIKFIFAFVLTALVVSLVQ